MGGEKSFDLEKTSGRGTETYGSQFMERKRKKKKLGRPIVHAMTFYCLNKEKKELKTS